MKPEQMEAQLKRRFDREWVSEDVWVNRILSRVAYGMNAVGRPTFRYWFGSSRVSRHTWLVLTCSEEHCPRHQATMQAWRESIGMIEPDSTCPSPQPPLGRLAPELEIEHEGVRVLARPAKLNRRIMCPNLVHPPIGVQVDAWDLFGLDGRFVATVPSLNGVEGQREQA